MRKTTLLALAVAVAAAVLLGHRTEAQGPANPGAAASARALAQGRFVSAEVLIQFRPGASDLDKQEARGWVNGLQKRLLRADANAGDLEVDGLPIGLPIETALALLAQHPAVSFAEPNWVYTHETIQSNDPYYLDGSLWGMYGDTTSPTNQFGSQAGEAWTAGQTGSSSVLVGVIDEGISFTHPDLAANIWTNPFDPSDGVDNDHNGYIDDIHGWDFYQNNNTIFDGGPGSSVDAHGTHVSGTIGGTGGNGAGVAGVNWNVGIISTKFLGPNGGSTADAVKALDYLTDMKTRHGLNLVATNNSWGGGGYSQALLDAIIRAAKAGILFDAAAGNSNSNNDVVDSYPSNYDTSVGTSTETAASYDSVIAVAAITGPGARASFSSYGATKVDLGAPGSGIWSTTPNNTYSNYSGTSMATPHVTGAAALYASINPGASAQTIRNAILASATNTPTPSLNGITVTGGRLNIGYFLSGAPPPPTAPSAPTGLGVTPVSTTQINLAWTDTSSNEDGFQIERCTNSGCSIFNEIATVGAGVNTYSNTGLAAGTTYNYRVFAYNGVGNSGYSNSAQTATLAAGGITLSTTGSKVKGTNTVNLTWSGASSTYVDIYRNNSLLKTTSNDGADTDSIGKGPGTYTYKVCNAGTLTCSNNSTVVF